MKFYLGRELGNVMRDWWWVFVAPFLVDGGCKQLVEGNSALCLGRTRGGFQACDWPGQLESFA